LERKIICDLYRTVYLEPFKVSQSWSGKVDAYRYLPGGPAEVIKNPF
jgi:hypothetical protein